MSKCVGQLKRMTQTILLLNGYDYCYGKIVSVDVPDNNDKEDEFVKVFLLFLILSCDRRRCEQNMFHLFYH